MFDLSIKPWAYKWIRNVIIDSLILIHAYAAGLLYFTGNLYVDHIVYLAVLTISELAPKSTGLLDSPHTHFIYCPICLAKSTSVHSVVLPHQTLC